MDSDDDLSEDGEKKVLRHISVTSLPESADNSFNNNSITSSHQNSSNHLSKLNNRIKLIL